MGSPTAVPTATPTVGCATDFDTLYLACNIQEYTNIDSACTCQSTCSAVYGATAFTYIGNDYANSANRGWCLCKGEAGTSLPLSGAYSGATLPTATPTLSPTPVPTALPTPVPTASPTASPTAVPTAVPTVGCATEENKNYRGNTLASYDGIDSACDCQSTCSAVQDATGFSYFLSTYPVENQRKKCKCKSSAAALESKTGAYSGATLPTATPTVSPTEMQTAVPTRSPTSEDCAAEGHKSYQGGNTESKYGVADACACRDFCL